MSDKTTPEVTRFLRVMEETGWAPYVIARRADEARAYALASVGIVSSTERHPGDKDGEWRLNLTRSGTALRRILVEQEMANAD